MLAVRGGKSAGHGLEHREALIYTLGKAAELEHLVMLQYLFAAFSLKQHAREGLPDEALVAVQRWRATLLSIGEQEMLHLALVQNLLTAVGAAPRLARPNFPMPAYSYPAGVRIELLPFGEAALRHFAFLERPEGMDIADEEGFEAIEQARRATARRGRRDRPASPGFRHDRPAVPVDPGRASTPGRAAGGGAPVHRPPTPQATRGHSGLRRADAVTDLACARAAIDVIVEQGEGARGDWRDAHFGRLVRMLDEYLDHP